MRILIDTNIFILREDNEVVSENLQDLLRILNEESVPILIHPLSVEEIYKDQNDARRTVSLSKIRTYPLLKSPPNSKEDKNYLNSVGASDNVHHQNDNNILYSVYKNAVDFFITEDRGIHRKASKLGIEDRVFTLDEAVTTFKEMYKEFQPKHPPAITEEKVHNLDSDDKIFDSLKKEYDDFEKWFIKISKEGRDCWLHFNSDGSIGAVLIYKKENEVLELKDETLGKKDRVKISTFKAIRTGYKIGELFLKLSIEYALKNNVDEIYLTHFSKDNDHLVDLVTEYGFIFAGKNKKYDDDVFIKNLKPSADVLRKLYDLEGPVKVAKVFYPNFYDGSDVNKFIVPIRPDFHRRLFVDYKERQTSIPEFAGDFIIEGNTIKKAYICNAVRKMAPGDLIFFYRSHDQKEITTVGIVEKVFSDKNKEDIIQIVGKRTVYSENEIEELSKKRTFIILFVMIMHLPNLITLDELKKRNVLKAAPQSITNITDKYSLIKALSGINGRFTFD